MTCLWLAACGSSPAGSAASATASDASATDSQASAGDAGKSPDTQAAVLDATTFSAAIGLAQCHTQSRCTQRSPALCSPNVGGPWPELAKAVAAGRASVDLAQAKACLAALEAQACAEAMTAAWLPPACRAAVVGKSAVGGACYTSLDCATGYCNAYDTTCPGVCVAFASMGGPCTNIGDCDPASGAVCTGGVCAKPPESGAPCQDGWSCAPSGHYCVAGKCAAAGGAGGPCSSDGECGPTMRCDGGMPFGLAGKCVQAVAQGGACGTTSEEYKPILPANVCSAGLRCAGGAYDSNAEGSGITAGTCQTAADVGGACVGGPANVSILAGCLDGLVCRDGACALPPSSGPCASGAWPCAAGSYCASSGQCVPQKKPGESCMEIQECTTSCSAVAEEPGTCVEPSPPEADKFCHEK